MPTILDGQVTWGGERDDEGHRTYTIVHLVESEITDGPYNVLHTPGLPYPGATWAFDDDYDPFAYCYPTCKISIHKEKEGDPNIIWRVEQKFSTKPLKKCQDTEIEDPLLEPQKVSGSFKNDKKEGVKDKDDVPIRSSSHETFHGDKNEWDYAKATVRIEQNVPVLGLPIFTQMMNRVNDAPLWGLAARCIKLSSAEWERKIQGSCQYYYTRTFEFDIDFDTHDRDLDDEGTRVLRGRWEDADPPPGPKRWVLDGTPDKKKIGDFIRLPDSNNNPQKVPLDGEGKPLVDIDDPVFISVQYYREANFLLLGVPTSF